MSEAFGTFFYCEVQPEVVIVDKELDYICGLVYLESNANLPVVTFAAQRDKEVVQAYYQKCLAEKRYIVEDTSLACILCDSLKPGDFIEKMHLRAVAKVYAKYMYDTGRV